MLLIPPPEPLQHAHISGAVHEGLTVTTADGRPARLAIIDDEGRILDAGPCVARAVWGVQVEVLRNFLAGKGHLRVRAPNAE